jgi:hypothetical protein
VSFARPMIPRPFFFRDGRHKSTHFSLLARMQPQNAMRAPLSRNNEGADTDRAAAAVGSHADPTRHAVEVDVDADFHS